MIFKVGSRNNISEVARTEMADFKANVLGSHPANIEMAYDYIMDNHGSFEDYFKWLGYSDQEIQQITSHFLK